MARDEYISSVDLIVETLIRGKNRMEIDQIIAELERMEENEIYR